MKLCKDYKRTLSWRITVCAPHKNAQVGVFPMVCGNACGLFYPSTTNLPRVVAPGSICEKSRMASFTYSALAANGRPHRRSSAPAALYIATSKSGPAAARSTSCGNTACGVTTTFAASNGSGKAWTARQPRHPWVGGKTGPNPTDRGKLGVKRSVLVDGRGVPLGLAIDGANVHDHKLFRATLDSLPIRRPRPTSRRPQHLCCDKGYDAEVIRREARRRRYTPHIKSRGDERAAKRLHGRRARRWVVERFNSWMNRFRRILIRWEKKDVNYQALLHLAFAYITWNQI